MTTREYHAQTTWGGEFSMSKRVRQNKRAADRHRARRRRDPAPPGTPGTPHPDPRAQLIQFHQSQRQQFEVYKQVLLDAIEATNSLADLLPEGTSEEEVAALRAEAVLLETELFPVQEKIVDTLRDLAEAVSEVLFPQVTSQSTVLDESVESTPT